MSKAKYSYNPKTVRYEKVGIQWSSWIFSGLSFIVFGALFFVGLLWVSNEFFESAEEARLRAENQALKRHKTIVESELYSSETLLASLYAKESELHKKIFLTDKQHDGIKLDRTQDIINFDLADFNIFTSNLLKTTSTVLSNASIRNYEFSKLFWPSQDDVFELQNYPTKTPVREFEMKSLACGFGNQINPFNKRLYRHNGIDIICEHGTEVIATGKGTIIAAVRSDIPGGKGSYVVIDHGHGYQSRYSNLSNFTVSFGQKVAQGQIIGAVGATGSAVAPHLHYEILKDGSVINPVLFFVEDISESELYQLALLNNQVKQSLD